MAVLKIPRGTLGHILEVVLVSALFIKSVNKTTKYQKNHSFLVGTLLTGCHRITLGQVEVTVSGTATKARGSLCHLPQTKPGLE